MIEFSKDPRAGGGARYSAVAIVLHWTIAAAILLQVILAGRMEGRTPEAFAVTQLHKSVGITILLLSLARLAWRLMNPPPPLPATMARWERMLARVTHVGLYGIMLAMPLTGWLMVSTSRIEVPTLLYGIAPWPDLPVSGRLWHEAGELGHEALGKLLYLLAGLHVAGALKHQLFSRDEPVLARMAPGARPGRWLEPRLLAILAAAATVVVLGLLVEPPRPGVAPPTPAVAAAEPIEAQAPTAAPLPEGVARWRVVAGSALGFTTAWSGQPIRGRFERWRADIVFGPQALDRSSVTVVVDLASVHTGDRQRDQVLPGADWFDVAAHPQATFRSRAIRQVGEGRYVADGTLELRGVSRPLSLPFELRIDGARAVAKGSARVDRLAFGVGQGDFAGTGQVPDEVRVDVELHAIRDER